MPPRALDHRGGAIPGADTRLIMPEAEPEGEGEPARSPGWGFDPFHAGPALGVPGHPSIPALLPVTVVPAPPNDTECGDEDLGGEAAASRWPQSSGNDGEAAERRAGAWGCRQHGKGELEISNKD